MLDSLIAFINKYITRNGNNEITGPVLNDVLIRIANILGSKVDKVEGKGLSTQDYTTADRNKLNGVEDGAQVNIINGVEVNGSALTPTPEGIIDIEIPVNVSELDNDKNYQTREDVELSVVGAKFNLADGIITFTRMNGTTFIIDLPTEMIVKSGYYDGTTSEIVLVLADDTEIRVPVSKLVNEYYGDDSTIELYSDSNDGYKFKFKISEAYRRKIDGAEQTANMVKTISESATDVQYPSAKAVWNSVKGLATNVQAFTQANTRDEIKSGETISVIFGKIKKWFADLKAVAFSGSYNDLSNRPEIGNGTITITQNGAAKGSFTTNQTGNTTIDLSDENTTYGIGNASTAGLVKSDSSNVEIRNDGKMIARRADLADYAKYGVRGFKASKANSAIKYALFGVVGLPLSGENDLYFSCTIEVQGAAAGSPLLGKYNVFIHAKGDTTYDGQIGCVYTSNGVSDIIIGEVVRSGANSQGMLYLWANVSHLTTTQEAYNVSVHGDINNDLEVRQNVHTTSIPYYSGVLINPELHVNIATSTTPGMVKSGGDITVASDGVVSVNDNSHNHTVANVTGLQNALSEKLSTTGLAEHARRLYATPNYRNGSAKRYLEICRATILRAYSYVMYDASFIINGGETLREVSMRARIMGWKGTSYNLDQILLRIEQCSEPAALDCLYAEYVPATSTEDGLIVVYMDTLNNTYANYFVTPLSSVSDFFKFVRNEQNNLSQGVASLPANGGTVIKGSLKAMATHDGSGNNIATSYLKLAGGNMTGNIRKKEGDYVALIPSKQYSSYYLQFMKITYVGSNFDVPIEIRLSGRGSHQYIIQVNNAGGGLNNVTFYTTGNSISGAVGIYYMYDSTAKTLSLMYHHSGGGGWEAAAVTDVIVPNNHYDKFTFDYTITAVGNIGWTKAGMTTFHYAISERANRDGNGNIIDTTYRKLSGVLELTDSNLATYFNSSTGALTIPNGVTTVIFNTSSIKKVSNIIGTCAVNGYRLTIAGQWLPVQKTSSSTTGCFSSYIYGYRAGAHQTSFDGATNRLTEAFEDFIYFNGVWYSKAY